MNELSNQTLAAIEPLLDIWGLPSATQRVAKRTASSMEEIRNFYDTMLPHMEEIINYLNQFPLDDLPEKSLPIAYAALAMCEVDNPVRWNETELSSGFAVGKMIEKTSFYDSRIV